MPDGCTNRSHLQRVFDQSGILPELLEPEDCDEEVLYLWDYFLNMCKRRTSNGYGVNPITNSELRAWAELHNIHLAPWEIEVIDSLESMYLKEANRD